MRRKKLQGYNDARRQAMARWRVATGNIGSGIADVEGIVLKNAPAGVGEAETKVAIYYVDLRADAGTYKGGMAVVGTRTNGMRNPTHLIANAISEALDPTRASGKVKAFKDMTPEEQAEMRRLYEKPGK